MSSSKDDYKKYYEKKLRDGQEYQDYVAVQLYKRGIVIQNILSRKLQLRKENLMGLEIKFDEKFGKTRRLYIEIAEKSHPDNPEYVPSGVFREDNNWLFGIGNYEEFFVFGKKQLRRLYNENPPWLYRPQPKSTSKAFCIPEKQAKEYAELHVVFAKKN